VTSPWIGFWQVVYDEADDDIIPFPALYTTVSLRRSGFSVYTATRYIEIRAAANRRPPAGWPATDRETREWYDTCSVSSGSCSWTESSGGWTVEHRADGASGGLAQLPTVRHAEVSGDEATVGDERWRRLSGDGSSPLAGAWEQAAPDERWTYLVTAGHFAVVRLALDGDEDGDSIDRVSANAGARVESARSFDHWPFITTHGVGSMDARKHETFRLTEVAHDAFSAGFASDGSDAVQWQRIE
jgi:hypothetical protein